MVNLHELLIPLLDVCGLLAAVVLVIGGLGGVVAVVLAPLNDLAQNGLVDVRDGDGTAGENAVTKILNHVADED